MVPLGRLRPRRGFFVPTIAIASPAFWFLYRAATHPRADQGVGWHLALAAIALLGGYLLAVLVTSKLETSGAVDHPLVRAIVDPETSSLALFVTLLSGVVAYVGLSAVVPIPGPIETVARLVGGVLALPLIVLYGGVIVVANGLGAGAAPAWLEAGAVAVGVGASVLWTAVLIETVT